MRHITCLLYDGFLLLDMAGPLSTFETMGQCGAPGYTIEAVGVEDGAVTSSCGIKVHVRGIRRVRRCDLLLVPGGASALAPAAYAALLPFVRRIGKRGTQVASVCSGAFILGAAGLLDGRAAATHWRDAAELQRRYPEIRVDDDSLFVRDGSVWTSAGITAGIDLALAIIEDDYGHDVARRVAQMLVVAVNRPGGQSQHSAALSLVGPNDRFNEVLVWARANLAQPLTVERLAERASLSIRQFTRAFTEATGVAPAKAIERLRIEHARAGIDRGARSLEQVATDSGFGSPDRMRRAFIRALGVTPQSLLRRA